MQKSFEIEDVIRQLVLDVVRAEIQKNFLFQAQDQPDKLLTLDDLQDYLPERPAKQTIYGWVNNRKIPYQKHGKRLYFRKSEVDCWLDNGRRVL